MSHPDSNPDFLEDGGDLDFNPPPQE